MDLGVSEQRSISSERLGRSPDARASMGQQVVAERSRSIRPVTKKIPWWTVASAGAAPAVLLAGFLLAASQQALPQKHNGRSAKTCVARTSLREDGRLRRCPPTTTSKLEDNSASRSCRGRKAPEGRGERVMLR
jgi:hypothetical protein